MSHRADHTGSGMHRARHLRLAPRAWSLRCFAYIAILASVRMLPAQTTNEALYPIDLPTTLRLAGAQNLDIQIARQRLKEAEAQRTSALERFFPWIAPGVTYHRRDGVAQAIPSGIISDAHFQSYSPGATVTAQVDAGDALYRWLAAKQLAKASDQALETQRQGTILSAAEGYFELAKAKALLAVLADAAATSEDYRQQLQQAVSTGLAFKGDELRVETQTRQYQIAVRRGQERQRLAGVDLARILHLDPQIQLVPQDSIISPLTLVPSNAPTRELLEEALRWRPELKESARLVEAARETEKGSVYGPLIPSVGAQAFGGGLGGGPDGGPGTFAAEGDYWLGLTWRIGPGGLFDSGRVRASKAQLARTEIDQVKLKDDIASQVVASRARVQSLSDQITLAEANLNSAAEALRLARERKQYGVGIVLETIQAQEDLVRARSDYLSAVAEFNKAQYQLLKAAGGLGQQAHAR